MKTLLSGTLLIVLLCITASAETYNWVYPRAAGWDATGRWTMASAPNDTNHWPRMPGDKAIIPSWVTNNIDDPSYDMKQFAFNAFGNQPVTIFGEMRTEFSNTWTQIGTFAPTDLVVFDNDGQQSVVSYYSYVYNWNRLEFPIWDTKVVLSNDLNIYVDGIATPDGYAHINRIIFGQDSGIFGDHHIIHHGPGSLNLGIVYFNSEPYETLIMTTKPTIISNGIGELEAGPLFGAPVMLTEGTRVDGSTTNFVTGVTRQGSWETIDVDLLFRGGNHRQNWTISGGMFSPLTNAGNLIVEDQANIQLYGDDEDYGDTWYYFDGVTKGTNFVINWWPGGKANFTGSISPGINEGDLGWLGFVDYHTNAGVIFGMPAEPVDLHIDVNGTDSDYISTERLPDFPVSRAALKLNIINGIPSATNIIWYSFENLTGEFASVEIMPIGATATIIYEDNQILVTDAIVPGDFAVDPNTLVFDAGETQKMVTVSSETEATVNIAPVGDATNWIGVPLQVAVSNGFPADVPVTLTTDVPAGSTGVVRFVGVEQTGLTNDVLVITSVTGDFAVDPDMLEFIEGETQKTVNVSTTTKATVTIAPVGDAASWISVPAQVTVSNGYPADVPVMIPEEQEAYSTGTVRFTSVEMPGLTNDVLVTVIPEPAAVLLLTLAAAALLSRRDR
jgi:hypothetical protein